MPQKADEQHDLPERAKGAEYMACRENQMRTVRLRAGERQFFGYSLPARSYANGKIEELDAKRQTIIEGDSRFKRRGRFPG